jgi:hypothetical protein
MKSSLANSFRMVVAGAFLLLAPALYASDFRVAPYLQYPAPEAMTITWFSNSGQDGSITWAAAGQAEASTTVTAVLAPTLYYHSLEIPKLPGGVDPGLPYKHRIRLTELTTDTLYQFTVRQTGSEYSGQFKTAPAADEAIRLVFYCDSETEPESTGKKATWVDPTGAVPSRTYVVDQTRGYAENLKVMGARNPDLIVIGGDLAESGGEQRDWDEFWVHNAGPDAPTRHIPILPALGNHEYYGGPSGHGAYTQPRSEESIAKYKTYFDLPANNAPNPEHEKRYYRLDYGPVTLIILDCVNGLPNGSTADPNFYLLGEGEGGMAPDFNPGSRQYEWLEAQLADAQKRSAFTFVVFHHVPYSVGPHGWPAGTGAGFDNQSGVPTRVLLPLFHKYGVDAVLCGHDEMVERSVDEGVEILPGGATRPNTIHVYDYGVGGDGLRGPEAGLTNPAQRFLAHTNAPEIWSPEGILTDGGKHYGHLEINVARNAENRWQAILSPVYVFPLMEKVGETVVVTDFERRVYDDEIILMDSPPSSVDASVWTTW